MPETKHMQEVREKYVFTLRMTKVSEEQWEGEVVRYPRSKQRSVAWGSGAGIGNFPHCYSQTTRNEPAGGWVCRAKRRGHCS
ncbi:MAG: hypothetical protein ABSB32_20515 [Thermodesulfobacteriota bacterium]|jgi:hypothetical protein